MKAIRECLLPNLQTELIEKVEYAQKYIGKFVVLSASGSGSSYWLQNYAQQPAVAYGDMWEDASASTWGPEYNRSATFTLEPLIDIRDVRGACFVRETTLTKYGIPRIRLLTDQEIRAINNVYDSTEIVWNYDSSQRITNEWYKLVKQIN